MKLTLPRFGSQEVSFSQDSIIEFPNGLPGFEDCKRFKLLHRDDGHEPRVFWLQSIDEPEVVFSITDPSQIKLSYNVKLSDEEADTLRVDENDDICLAVMLSHPLGESGEVAMDKVAALTRSPIAINITKRRAIQKSLVNPDLTITG
ncbi:flagellar assembly protein FliW [Ferriphaselus sp. R-1]|uniref:flagellar assembly protein FliW n=1 Tax=Ferriphaselus sp. R-1 TaxID=1485544 RepID=UPI000557628A|nr:flagellar assembly protein FliW [Ferriphaselus sp. R-1]